jgi:hypothetical protein
MKNYISKLDLYNNDKICGMLPVNEAVETVNQLLFASEKKFRENVSFANISSREPDDIHCI